jgi:hypothetical protein
MIMSAHLNPIVSEEDKRYCERFWKVMPFFFKDELIKGAFPDSANATIEMLKTYIPNVREMYKGLVAHELLDLRDRWEYCIQHEIESPWDVLELFKPLLFFKRNEKEAFITFLNHKGINDDGIILEAIKNYILETPPNFDGILAKYWEKHNPNYLGWLDEILNQVPESKLKIIRSRKNAILIAAMNETELDKVFDACDKAYGVHFGDDMAFIVFHNYKSKHTLSKEVWISVDNVKGKGDNVLVINKEVPDYFDTATVKKVLNDIAFHVYGSACLDSTFFLMDADVYKLSDGIFHAAKKALMQDRILAASPEFDYDQNEKYFYYPVLKLIFDVRRDLDCIAVREEEDYNLQMTYGMCSAIYASTSIFIGGIKPTNYEDGFLTNELRWYSGGWINDEQWTFKKGHYSIYPLSIDKQYVYVNAQKEMNNLRRGQEAFVHWSAADAHEKLSGIGRTLIQEDNFDYPEFDNFTESNVVKALNKAWLFMYKFRPSEEVKIGNKEINHSKRLIRVLKKYRIEIVDAKVEVVNNASFNLKTGEGDFMIRRINQIKFIAQTQK